MAIQLKKYNQQVKPSGESGGVEGSLRTAGLPGQAIAQAAEKVGASIQQVIKTKNELDSRARKVAFDKYNDEFLVDLERQQQDALLGKGQYAPTTNPDGSITENRIPFEKIESEVIAPAKQEYESWLSQQKYTRAELNYINSTKNKTFSQIDVKRDQVEFKRDVSQKKFDLEQSIISDTRKILEIQDQYGNNPDAVMSDVDKATLEELTLNQQSNINFLKQISDPGDAEQVESLVLYQTIEKSIRQYQKDVAGNLLKGDERIKVLNKIRSQINRLSEGGEDAPLMGKHSMELNNLLLAQETIATDEIVTEYNKIYSATALDIKKGNFQNKNFVAEELTRRTADMPAYLKNSFISMVLGEIGLRADADLAEDAVGTAYERITTLINGGNVGLKDVYTAIGKIKDPMSRELLWFVFSDFSRELGERDSNGMYKMIYDGKGNKIQLDSETATFWRQIGSYVALFEKQNMIQDQKQESIFITNKLKKFQAWRQGNEDITFQEFMKKEFTDDANKIIENDYRTLTFQDIYGIPGMRETTSPYKFVQPDEAPTFKQESDDLDSIISSDDFVVPGQDKTVSWRDLGTNVVLVDIPVNTSGQDFLTEDDVGFVGSNMSVDNAEAMYGPGATVIDGLVMFDKGYKEVEAVLNDIRINERGGKKSKPYRDAAAAFERRKEIEDDRALAVIHLMKREMKTEGTGITRKTVHGDLVHTPESRKLMTTFGLPEKFIEEKIDRHQMISHPETPETIVYKPFENKVYDYDNDIYQDTGNDGDDLRIAKDIRKVQETELTKVTFIPVEPDDFDPDAWTIDQPIPMTYYPVIGFKDGQRKITALMPIFRKLKDGYTKTAQGNLYGQVYAKALGVNIGDFTAMARRGMFGNKYKQQIEEE